MSSISSREQSRRPPRIPLLVGIAYAAALAMSSAPLAAHHSPAMLYDLSKELVVTGVVTEYQLGNPHMRIYLDVDNAGTIEKWLAEGGSRTQMIRVGWTAEDVEPGDRVTVRGHPPRDTAQHLIHMEYLTLPDGTERYAEDIRADEFNERRRRPR